MDISVHKNVMAKIQNRYYIILTYNKLLNVKNLLKIVCINTIIFRDT